MNIKDMNLQQVIDRLGKIDDEVRSAATPRRGRMTTEKTNCSPARPIWKNW
jgi:trans-2-enoyl-CoA reductase